MYIRIQDNSVIFRSFIVTNEVTNKINKKIVRVASLLNVTKCTIFFTKLLPIIIYQTDNIFFVDILTMRK